MVLHHIHGEGSNCTGHHDQVHTVPHLPQVGAGVEDQAVVQDLERDNQRFEDTETTDLEHDLYGKYERKAIIQLS